MVQMSLGETLVNFAHEEITELEVVTENEIGGISKYSVDENGVAKTIEFDCTGAFDEITSIGNYGLYMAFYNCTGITGSLSFPNLTTIDKYGLYYAFHNCKGITGSISFPKLTTVGTNGLNNAFQNCTGITELHFRADMRSVIEAQSGYSSKFGATNATIYFDL